MQESGRDASGKKAKVEREIAICKAFEGLCYGAVLAVGCTAPST